MTHYSVQQSDRIFVKGYGFLSFTKHMGGNLSSSLLRNLLTGKDTIRVDEGTIRAGENF